MLELNRIKSPISRKEETDLVDVPLLDDEGAGDIYSLAESLEDVGVMLEKEADINDFIDPNLVEEKASKDLLAIVADILASNTNIDAKADLTDSLEGIAIPGFGVEGRLAELGEYILETIRKLIKRIKSIFGDKEAKRAKSIKELSEVKKTATLGMSQNASLKEGKDTIDLGSRYTDKAGSLKAYDATNKVVSALNELLLNDMSKIMNKIEVTQVDLFKVLNAEKSFKFSKVSGYLDTTADLVYQIKVGLIAIIDGIGKGKKVDVTGRNTFILTSIPGVEFHFDLGDIAKYESIKLTADKVREATTLKVSVVYVDEPTPVVPVLTLKECLSRVDTLTEGLNAISKYSTELEGKLKDYEGMFEYNYKPVDAKLKDADTDRMRKKVRNSSEQMLLATMKLFSGITTQLMNVLDQATKDHVKYVVDSVNSYDITDTSE